MTETPSETTDLKAQYTAQVAADLERNAKEQDRLRAEIDALQEQLQGMQRDQSVLVNMQQALGVVTPEAAPEAEGVAAPSVPRQKAATTSETGKRTRAKKATPLPAGRQADEEVRRRQDHGPHEGPAHPRRAHPPPPHRTERTALRRRGRRRAHPGSPRPPYPDQRRAHHPRRAGGQEQRPAHQAGFVRLLHRSRRTGAEHITPGRVRVRVRASEGLRLGPPLPGEVAWGRTEQAVCSRKSRNLLRQGFRACAVTMRGRRRPQGTGRAFSSWRAIPRTSRDSPGYWSRRATASTRRAVPPRGWHGSGGPGSI